MIGQTNNLANFNKNENKPHLTILIGNELSGKRTLALELSKFCSSKPIFIDNNIDAVRNMMKTAKETNEQTVFIIENFQDISLEAQNATLKIFEEPDPKIYFILTCTSADLMLDTILSRGFQIKMEPYSKEELSQITQDKFLIDNLNTPSEIYYWQNRNLQDFYKTVDKIYEYISYKNLAECSKLLAELICYDIMESKIYYLFFLRRLEYIILRKYNWKSMNQLNSFSKLTNSVYRQAKSKSIKKDDLIFSYMLKCSYLWSNKK